MILILTILFAITQLGDWYTTRTAISKGGSEGNPIAKFFMKYLGIDGYLLVKVIATTSLVFFIVAPMSTIGTAALIAFYVWVLYNNYNVIKKL